MKTAAFSRHACGLLFLFSVLAPVFTSAQTIDNIPFRFASIGQPGKSLAAAAINKDTSSIVVAPTTPEGPDQRWLWVKGTGGHARLINLQVGANRYLALYKDKTGQVRFMFAPQSDQSGQFWRMLKRNDGTTRIANMWLGAETTLSVSATGELAMLETNEAATHLWKLIPESQPVAVIAPEPVAKPEPVKNPEPVASGGQVVNAEPVADPVAVSEPVGAGKKVTASAGATVSALDTAAFYRLVTNEVPEKSVGVESEDGRTIQVVLQPTENQTYQQWKLRLSENGYHLSNRYYPGQSMEVADPLVMLKPTKVIPQQLWKLDATPAGQYQITSLAIGSARSLDFVEDGEEHNELQLRDFNSTVWTLVKVGAPNTKQKVTPQATANRDRLLPGEQLTANQLLTSANGAYTLVQQTDGNLVIYNAAKSAVWATNTHNRGAKRTIMQKDGNLVQYQASESALWSTNTHGNPGAYAQLQNDGVLVIFGKDNRKLWSSK